MHDSVTKHATRACLTTGALARGLPAVLMVGPRPRPAPPLCSREGAARERALTERLLRSLVHFIMPHAATRAARLGRAIGPAVVLHIGARSTSHANACDTAAHIERLVCSLAPELRFVRIWMPPPTADGGGHSMTLLDDDLNALNTAPLVVLDYDCDDVACAGDTRRHSNVAMHDAREGAVAHEQSYTVSWSPGVYVRAEASLDARPLALRRAGSIVHATRQWGAWVEVMPAVANGHSFGGRGAGGWMLADGDSIGLGRLLTPSGTGAREHPRSHLLTHPSLCPNIKDCLAQVRASTHGAAGVIPTS